MLIRHLLHSLILVVLCQFVLASSTFAADEKPAAPAAKKQLSYVVFAPGFEKKSLDALKDALAGGDEPAKVNFAPTLANALNAKEQVVVIAVQPGKSKQVGPYSVDRMLKRKVIGIGYETGALFEAGGLNITAGHCAHGTGGEPRAMLEKGALPAMKARSIFLFEPR